MFLDGEFEALTLDFEPFDVVVAATEEDQEMGDGLGAGEEGGGLRIADCARRR